MKKPLEAMKYREATLVYQSKSMSSTSNSTNFTSIRLQDWGSLCLHAILMLFNDMTYCQKWECPHAPPSISYAIQSKRHNDFCIICLLIYRSTVYWYTCLYKYRDTLSISVYHIYFYIYTFVLYVFIYL